MPINRVVFDIDLATCVFVERTSHLELPIELLIIESFI